MSSDIPQSIREHFRDRQFFEDLDSWLTELEAVEAVGALARSKGDFWERVGDLLAASGKIKALRAMQAAFNNIHKEVTKPEGRHEEHNG